MQAATLVTVTGQIDIVGPAGSGEFGIPTMLPNGNFVVVDPLWDDGGTQDVGAVYLYNGVTLALISTLTGTTANDQIGSGGVAVLPSGNFVVVSPLWDNGGAPDAGAVTWVNGASGLNGAMSTTNSLYGTTAGDGVGSNSIVVHPEAGYYVVGSPLWDRTGAITDAGAVTWVDGTTGHPYNEAGSGAAVSTTNSLVGGTSNDYVGSACTSASTQGSSACVYVRYGNDASQAAIVPESANYRVKNGAIVIGSPFWDLPGGTPIVDAGAVTLMPATGMAGTVTSANSLVGATAGDKVGGKDNQSFPGDLEMRFSVLANGNYVVGSPLWDLSAGAVDAGAVTWVDGATGLVGAVSAANSLHGSTTADQVGNQPEALLDNGNYAAVSSLWNYVGVAAEAGAVTWVNGTDGTLSGGAGPGAAVSVANSLVSSNANLKVGEANGVLPLTNGNYIVATPDWDNGGTADVGAVTWGNGASGTSGVINTTNSLYGTTAGDRIGTKRIRLEGNGNYLVVSPAWDDSGTADVGAVTWVDGSNGHPFGEAGPGAAVSATNSLVGSTADDQVGGGDTMALLNNGNYIVISPRWDDGGTANVGAVTWGDGSTGIAGLVSIANSLYGTTADDQVGSGEITARVSRLSNGNYVIASPNWDNGGTANVGAVTWGNGASGITGPVTPANSLIGATANDQVGARQPSKGTAIVALSDGNYTVLSFRWNGVRGAFTWGNGASGTTGIVSAANSLVGTNPGDLIAPDRFALPSGQYLVKESGWNGSRGAVAWSARTPGLTGVLAEPDTVFGSTANGGNDIVVSADTYSDLLNIVAVGRRADNIVTIMFPAWPITTTLAGSGSGVVTSVSSSGTLPGGSNSQFWPDQVNCGITCTANVRINNVITLTATADPGSTFVGWSGGGCSGTGDCVVTANAAKEVTATFVKATLTIVIDADPADDTVFEFSVDDGNTVVPFSLQDPTDSSWTRSEIPIGLYTVEQISKDSWKLTDIQCNSQLGTSTFDLMLPAVKIDLALGDDVTCTFVNEFIYTIYMPVMFKSN